MVRNLYQKIFAFDAIPSDGEDKGQDEDEGQDEDKGQDENKGQDEDKGQVLQVPRFSTSLLLEGFPPASGAIARAVSRWFPTGFMEKI